MGRCPSMCFLSSFLFWNLWSQCRHGCLAETVCSFTCWTNFDNIPKILLVLQPGWWHSKRWYSRLVSGRNTVYIRNLSILGRLCLPRKWNYLIAARPSNVWTAQNGSSLCLIIKSRSNKSLQQVMLLALQEDWERVSSKLRCWILSELSLAVENSEGHCTSIDRSGHSTSLTCCAETSSGIFWFKFEQGLIYYKTV